MASRLRISLSFVGNRDGRISLQQQQQQQQGMARVVERWVDSAGNMGWERDGMVSIREQSRNRY